MLPRRKKWLLLSICLLCAIIASYLSLNRQPAYQGKSADQWFDLYAVARTNRDAATQAFVAMGTNAVPFLLRELGREDHPLTVRYRAKWNTLPPSWRSMLPAPRRGAHYENEAIVLLGELGPAARLALPWLLKIIRDQKEFVISLHQHPPYGIVPPGASRNLLGNIFSPATYTAVGKIGGADPQMISALLQDGDSYSHQLSASLLTNAPVRPALLAGAPLLTNALAHGGVLQRRLGLIGLIELLPENQNGLPFLLAAAEKDPDLLNRTAAIEGLRRSRGHESAVISSLVNQLTNPVPLVTSACIATLRQIRDPGAVMQTMSTALNKSDPVLIANASRLLSNHHTPVPEAMARLLELKNSETPLVRHAATHALWIIEKAPKRFEQLLEAGERSRWVVAGQPGSAQSNEVLPILAQLLLHDPSERVRGNAANTLRRMGPLAEPAIPALHLALQDPYFNVREEAADALKSIEKK